MATIVIVVKKITKINNEKKPLLRFLFFAAKLVYGKVKFVGEYDKNKTNIYVANHAQFSGPLISKLYFENKKIWCIADIMNINRCAKYMYNEFWKNKYKKLKWLFVTLSYLLCPFVVYIFSNIETIAVYKDSKCISTFKNSLNALMENSSLVIFPEKHEVYNDIVNEFEQNFVSLAKMYHKKSGKDICFVPVYIASKIKTVAFGKEIKYDSANNEKDEQQRICLYLKNEITSLAKSLPCHTVIPYENLKKKDYPKSI